MSPYLVTTRRCAENERVAVRAEALSRRAVATLEEARDWAMNAAYTGGREPVDVAAANAVADQAANLSEFGGTVGPLPDGIVIEVEQVDFEWLLRWWCASLRRTALDAEIVDAFNSRAGAVMSGVPTHCSPLPAGGVPGGAAARAGAPTGGADLMPDERATGPEQVSGEALFRKLAEVMGEIGYVEKRGRNDFHKYDYVTEADLVEAVRAKLAERHVALIPSVQAISERPYKTDRGKESVVTTVTIAFAFVDGETGAMYRTEWAGQGDDPADKGLYKAYTGAVKYFLMKTFLIPTGDDPEGDRRTDERSQGRTAAKPQLDHALAAPILKTAKEMIDRKVWTPAQLKQQLTDAGASNAKSVGAALQTLTATEAEEFHHVMVDLLVTASADGEQETRELAEQIKARHGERT